MNNTIHTESDEKIIGQIAEHYKAILRLIGEDPEREGLVKTPQRAAKALFDVQERLTHEICALLEKNLSHKGVIVVCSAEHLCMKMRGVEKQDSATVTIDYSGEFAKPELRDAFFRMIE